MEGHVISILAGDMGRSERFWKDPQKFNPDRFLGPESEGEAAIGDGSASWKEQNARQTAAWQPFEKGPRNCIGQQLALLEAKVISVLTVRWFDFESCYPEDGKKESVDGWGGRAYQVFKVAARPKDGIPMRVRRVVVSEE